MPTTLRSRPFFACSSALVRTMGVLLLALPSGCGSDDDDDEDFGQDVAGLYADETFTESTTGCDTEGPDSLATQEEQMLGIRPDRFVVPFVIVATCKDATDCANATAGSIFSGLFGGAMLTEKTNKGYVGDGSLSWTRDATSCAGTMVDHSLERLAGSRVRFERRRYEFSGVAFDTKDDEGKPDCTTESMRAAAKQQGCSELRVITAVRQGDLPPPPEGS